MKTSILLLFFLFIPTLALAQTAEEYVKMGLAKKVFEHDAKGAIQDYTKAIELKPNYTVAYFSRGLAKGVLGDYRGAIQDFNKAIELTPNNADAYYSKGLAKINLGQIDSGCLDLSKAGELGYMDAYDAIKQNCQ